MKVAFFSNYLTHHQIPFCEAMCKRKDIEFHFVSTMPMEDERKAGGWEIEVEYPYELKAYLSDECERQAMDLAKNSDVIIIGAAPERYVRHRMKHADNKLTFRYSERIYKNGRWRALSPKSFILRFQTYFKYFNQPLYMLCASAYTASDLALSGTYLGRCYKWGYFPETKKYDDIANLIARKKPSSILWVARFIDWKHPEVAVDVIKKLKDNGYRVTLDMVGIGPLLEKVQKKIADNDLQNDIRILGSMSPERVRKKMEEAEIFLFTSDRNEGWGAVLNEAMNSGCAVVANKEIGSVPFLLKDGENGLIYNGNNVDEIYKKVKTLLDNVEFARSLGYKAYYSIIKKWNAESAADRLIKLIESGRFKKNNMFEDGPCSRA